MNVDTNHLKAVDPKDIDALYEKIPSELEHAARVVLGGRPGAYVSRASGGKLSRWAAKKRKAKRKAARAARKQSR